MSTNSTRRVTDHRKDEDWPSHVRSDGLINRMAFTAPGERFKLRGGTGSLPCGRIQQITVDRAMELLVEQGVFEKNDDNQYTKKAFALGANGFDLQEMIDDDNDRALYELDVNEPEARKAFVKAKIGDGIRESLIEYGAFDFSFLLDQLTDASCVILANLSKNDIQSRFNSLQMSLFGAFETVFEQNGITLDSKIGVILNGETRASVWGNMLRAWINNVIYGLVSHPLLKEA